MLNFTDTNDNIDNQTYHFFIDAIYTEGTSAAPQSIESPDPTIVNAGTDGSMTFKFGKASSQEQARPTAVAA